MILIPTPMTRVNDQFIFDQSIDATPITQSVTHTLITTPPSHASSYFQSDFYQQIGIDIVTETVFHYPYPCITEKTLRPISCKRMFIIVGPSGILQLLRSKGFQTFGNIIDESYDSIVDPVKRFNSILHSINAVMTLPLSFIKEYYVQNQSLFDENFYVLQNIQQHEFEQFKLRLS